MQHGVPLLEADPLCRLRKSLSCRSACVHGCDPRGAGSLWQTHSLGGVATGEVGRVARECTVAGQLYCRHADDHRWGDGANPRDGPEFAILVLEEFVSEL